MPTLALKLVLTPALIAVASLAGRRWGPVVSGWFVALPFTTGPVVFFLALAHGRSFAAAAATGTLSGTFSESTFCLAYAWLAIGLGPRRNAWLCALATGALTFVTATVLLARFPLPLAPLIPLACATLLLALRLMPRDHHRGGEGAGARRPADESAPKGPWPQSPSARSENSAMLSRELGGVGSQARADVATLAAPPRWDLPVRMAAATAFVVLLTALAPILGARLTGLLAPFPLFASVLAVFAHVQHGPAAAAGVLRGLLLGLFAFAGFFVALALLLVPLGIAPAFAGAIALALIIQAGSLWLLRTRSRSR